MDLKPQISLETTTHDKVILGDKKESRVRYAQWNATHVPDIIHARLATDELLEIKVVSPLIRRPTPRAAALPSTAATPRP